VQNIEYFPNMSWQESLAGATAGVVGTVLGYPLDVMKTRMQVTNKSIWTSCKNIYQEAGVFSFYRGVLSPLVALTLLNTLNFTSYAAARKQFGVPENFNVVQTGFEWRIMLAGGIVGPCASLISTPFELIKTQMQLVGLTAKANTGPSAVVYRNSVHAAYSIGRQHGIVGLYRGFAVNTTREVVFLSTYFTVYEHLKSAQLHAALNSASSAEDMASQTKFRKSVAVPLAGGIAGSIGWFLSFPLDCIKSNIQMRPLATSSSSSSSSSSSQQQHQRQQPRVPGGVEVARQLLRTKGIMGLYAGVLPSILRAFVVSSTRFSAYEAVMDALGVSSSSSSCSN
jgi:solute carrier family 25 (mitochondrial carnitine/acylcarnitine transporter), member 20/29